MNKSTRHTQIMVSIILTFVFLFIVTLVDATILKDVAFPAFAFLGVVAGGGMVSKTVEHSKWSKHNADV